MSRKSQLSEHLIRAHRHLAGYEISDLRAYARLTTKLMNEQASAHQEHVKSAISGLSAGEREAYLENNAADYEDLVSRFPNQQQIGLLIFSYSIIEARLVSIARSILHQSNVNLDIKDLAGESPFQKVRKCLAKVGNISVPEHIWNSMDGFRHLRNSAIHNAGYLPDKPQPALQKLLEKSPSISTSELEHMRLGPGLVMEFLDTADALLRGIFDAWLIATREKNAA